MSKKQYVIFTDLDGTLLDKTTFKPGRANQTLKLCHECNIPVVFVSAKTRAEMEVQRRDLNNTSPFVSENGGGLYIPKDSFDIPLELESCDNYRCFRSNTTIVDLRKTLKDIAKRLGIRVLSFGEMSLRQVMEITGLSRSGAVLAQMREFDEPFQIIDESPKKVRSIIAAINNNGYRYTEGGILHHIMGDFDKGDTLLILKKLYQKVNPEVKFIGLGDAFNDMPMLKIVDSPFLVRHPDGSHEDFPDIDNLIVTDGIGPEGFAEAVEGIISKL